jgi:hypothetical protein
MKKVVFLCFIVIAVNNKIISSEIISFNKENNGTNAIVVPTGEQWKIISYSCSNDPIEVFTSTNRLSRIGIINPTGERLYGEDGQNGMASGVSVVGPAVIWVGSISSYYFVFDKTKNLGPQNYTSSTSVVIPSSSTGDVDIKLEQSADNVTWTECLPGTYNSSTLKRFFRLRAVEK